MQKNVTIIVTIFFFTNIMNAQIGRDYAEIHRLLPDANTKGLRSEGDFLIEDLIINSYQKKFITYNKDSIVVGIGNFDKNLFDEASYSKIILKEVPKFKSTKTAKVKTTIYLYDEVNTYLVILNPNSEEELFPLKGFFILTEPFIIAAWTQNISNWE